jgi:hypothetical protein
MREKTKSFLRVSFENLNFSPGIRCGIYGIIFELKFPPFPRKKNVIEDFIFDILYTARSHPKG